MTGWHDRPCDGGCGRTVATPDPATLSGIRSALKVDVANDLRIPLWILTPDGARHRAVHQAYRRRQIARRRKMRRSK